MVDHQPGVICTFVHEGVEVKFFVKDATEEIQKYHYAGGFYEAEELAIMQRYYQEGTAFVDIGCNIGNHAVFAEKILKAPEVIVFEPNPVAIAFMEINFTLNKCEKINRNWLGFPVSDRMGLPMVITHSPENNLGHTMFGLSAEGKFRTITGDFALSRTRVGFIKIDAEEMEFQVLAGLKECLSIWRPSLFIEIVEAREEELASWASQNKYSIAESQKRYHLLRNYVLVPI